MKAAVTVIIPAYNAERELRLCLTGLRAGDEQPEELFVADDGSTDSTAQVAREFGATVVPTHGRVGPARARNLAARQATGSLLVYFDADVVPHPQTIGRLRTALENDPALDAIIGAYDDAPACGRFLSQYRNLQHCFVHRTGRRAAFSFWTGCGAVRRESFLARGGFLESYGKPAIEDVEFGVRLIRSGGSIALDPRIQVKHLKRWTFRDMVRTDIFQRAAPWTELIVREGKLPDDLNLATSQRVSAGLALLALLAAAAGVWVAGPRLLAALLGTIWIALAAFWIESPQRILTGVLWLASTGFLWWLGSRLEPSAVLPATAIVAFAGAGLALNAGFFRFLARRRGLAFAVAAAPFFLLYLTYSSLTFAIVSLRLRLTRL